MGYAKCDVINALKATDNDLNAALDALRNANAIPDAINMGNLDDLDEVDIPDEFIAQLSNMGFSLESARKALQQFGGEMQGALDHLLQQQRLGGIDITGQGPSSSSSAMDQNQNPGGNRNINQGKFKSSLHSSSL